MPPTEGDNWLVPGLNNYCHDALPPWEIPIFADTLESGTTSAWSRVVP